MTAPTNYSYQTVPVLRGGGHSVSEVEAPLREHVCGNCRQPESNKGVWWCKNNVPDDSQDVEHAMEAYAAAEARRFDTEVDRQEGWF